MQTSESVILMSIIKYGSSELGGKWARMKQDLSVMFSDLQANYSDN